MKPRRLTITIEVETDAKTNMLMAHVPTSLRTMLYDFGYECDIEQVQVNVIKPKKKKR